MHLKLTHCGFIFKGPGMTSTRHHARMDAESFSMSIRGVGSVDEAKEAAKDLVAEGIQLLELCGGFDAAMTAAIAEAIGHAVPVGAVAYSAEEKDRLDRFLKS